MIKFILGFLFVMGPVVVSYYFGSQNIYIVGIHEVSSELLTFLFLIYLSFSRKIPKNNLILAFSFLFVGMGDLLYIFNFSASSAEPTLSLYLREIGYLVYIVLLFFFLIKSLPPKIMNRVDLLVMFLVGGVYAYLSFKYMLSPYLNREVLNSFFVVTTTAYALIRILVFSLLIPVTLRINKIGDLIFAQLILLMGISDLAITYQTAFIEKLTTLELIFEQGWEVVFASMFVLLVLYRKTPEFKKEEWVSYLSIRTLLMVFICAGVVVFVSILKTVNLFGSITTFGITTLVMMGYIVWFFAGIISCFLSNRTLAVNKAIPFFALDESDITSHGFVFNKITNVPKLHEIDYLVGHYNNLVTKTNQLLEITIKNSKLASIGQSTAMVAHDVRKPLTGMKALLISLPYLKNEPEHINQMIAEVDRSIDRTNTMLNEMLEFSRDAMNLERKEHNPQSIVMAALGDVLRDKADTDVSIEYFLNHRGSLHVDGDRVIRVLTNVIGNAVEAMNGKGKIWIKTDDAPNSSLKMTIGNNGPPIPEDVRKKIFEPFFTKGKKGGTGLGLAICQKIIEMHGGSITVESRPDCTEFILKLPASPGNFKVNETELVHHSNEFKPFRKEEAARGECGDTINATEFMNMHKKRGRQAHMLIVDDEPLFRETLRSMLMNIKEAKDHVKIIEADSAEAGLELFKVREFDYVIADIDLEKNRINGYEFAGIVLDKYPNSYVLIHSNKRRDEMDKNIRQIAGDKFMGFLPKPMRSSELLQFLACKTFEVSPKSPTETKKKANVLLVNDDEALRIALKWQIKSAGDAQVVEASSVSDALSKIAGNNIDLILSDINLGDGEPSGYDLLKKVREDGKSKARFYMVSGYSKQSEESNALSFGADGYCQLPLEEDHLKEVLNSCKI